MKYPVYSFVVLAFLFSCGGDAADDTAEDTANTTDQTNKSEEPEFEIDIQLNPITTFPEGCEVNGHTVDAFSWKDRNGTNYFIRTINEIEFKETEWGEAGTQYLWAYHYKESPDGEISLLKETTDFVENCDFDLNMGHVAKGISLTDIDGDEIGEIAFIYRLTCTSDVSPSTQKLIMLEDGNKYPLRGQTQVMGGGGDYEVGNEFDTAPAGFLDHAKQLWSENMTEYEDM